MVRHTHGRARLLEATVAATLVLATAACASGDSSSGPSVSATTTRAPSDPGPTSSAPPVAPPPSLPLGGTDCGEANALSGWPTTTTTWPDAYACIVDAMGAGTPAWMVFVSAGQGDSGRRTSDGYELPTRRVVTWVVVGPGELRRTTDLTDEGGTVSTETCAGLSAVSEVAAPEPTGCTPS